MARELRRGYTFRPQGPIHLFKWHCIGNHGLGQPLSRISSNLCQCYKLQLLIMLSCAVNYPFLTELQSPLVKTLSAHTGKVSANPVSSVVLRDRHGEHLEMQIFASAIQHVGWIEKKNLLQEGWKKTTTDTWISSADNSHAFITSRYFLFSLTVPASGVK